MGSREAQKGEVTRARRGSRSLSPSQKAALDEFENGGGVDPLVQWGEANPTEFYTLWSLMLCPTARRASPESNAGQP